MRYHFDPNPGTPLHTPWESSWHAVLRCILTTFSPITVVSYILSKAKLTEEDQTFKDRVQHFDNDLIKVFGTDRDFSAGTNLSRNEKRILKQTYLDLKNGRRSKTYIFFEQLRDCGDLATIEKVFKFLKEIEVHYHQYSDENRINNCIMDTFRDHPTLNAWVMDHFKQGVGYKLKKFFFTKFPKVSQFWTGFGSFLPWLTLPLLVLFLYINIWKDVIIFSELMHYCNVILVSKCRTSFWILDLQSVLSNAARSIKLRNRGRT